MKKTTIAFALMVMCSAANATDVSWRGGKKYVEIDCIAKKGRLNEKCHERLYDICDGPYAIKDVDQSVRMGKKSSARVEAQCTGKRGGNNNWNNWKRDNRNDWWD